MLNSARRAGVSTNLIVVMLLFMVGMFLGPLQGVYCVFFSGKSVGNVPITISQPNKLSLSPEMNPIRFNAKVRYEDPAIITGSEERASFDCRLSQGAQTIWEDRLSITEKDDEDDKKGFSIQFGGRSKTSTKAIRSFEVTESGEYEFLATPTSRKDLKVHEVNLLVRRNVRQTNVPSFVAGVVLMASPLLVCFIRFRGEQDVETSPA